MCHDRCVIARCVVTGRRAIVCKSYEELRNHINGFLCLIEGAGLNVIGVMNCENLVDSSIIFGRTQKMSSSETLCGVDFSGKADTEENIWTRGGKTDSSDSL